MKTLSGAEMTKVGDAFWLTRAEVCLDRYVANVTRMKRYIGPDVRLMAVVKADGYGHGAVMIGKTALQSGADQLAVYTPAEAIYLRKAGVEGTIVVLGPISPIHAALCVRYRITPCINSVELAQALGEAAKVEDAQVRYHVEIDTGLTRYGIMPDEALDLLQAISSIPRLAPQGMFTHFASADEKSKDSTWKQFHKFMKLKAYLSDHGIEFPTYHVAASSATLDFPEMHLNLVRCGISLYGYYPSPYVKRSVDLAPVMVLGSHLARVRSVPRGTGVSYGHDWKAKHRSVIGLVPFGYADGMPRTVQGRGQVLVRGHRAPIVGRVAMDQFMVDLSHIEEASEGDAVTLIGKCGDEEITADELGSWAGTISYDVLSGVSTRVPRLYVRDGAPVYRRSGMTMAVEPVETKPNA